MTTRYLRTRCPKCGTHRVALFLGGKYRLHEHHADVRVRCVICQLVFICYMPTHEYIAWLNKEEEA